MLTSEAAPPLKHATLGAALQAAAGEPDQGLIFVGLDESETFYAWSDIVARARRSAAALAARGVKPGDRVAMVLPTSIGFMDAFFGALFAGAVPVPLYPPVRLGRLDEYHASTVRMLQAVNAAIVVLDARVKPVLGVVVHQAGIPYADAEKLAAPGPSLSHQGETDDLGLIQFSSGSTVDPKAVALTQRQLLSQCAALDALMRRTPGNTRVGCTWLPLYHDMGLIGCLLSAAYYPGRLVLIAPEHFLAKPALWLRAISRHRAFISPAPNFAYAMCSARVHDLSGLDLSCWRLALNGAEPVLPQTMDAFTQRFAAAGFSPDALLPVYGLSEAALAVTFARAPKRLHRGMVSVGVPVPGFSVRVVDEAGREVLGEGRVQAAGPSVMSGYFNDPIATARALQAGWLDTGDRGFIDGEELFITGREKDIVIIRGANYMPQTFETPLLEVSGLRTGCAVALGEVFADAGGEALLVLAERAQRTERSDAAIRTDIDAALVGHTGIKPHRVELLAPGTLPRTSSGKLRRGEALARFRAGTLQPPAQVNVVSMSRAMLRSTLGYVRSWLDQR